MEKYMLLYTTELDERPEVSFERFLGRALDRKADIECGLGGYVELYERLEDEDGTRAYIRIE